MLDRKVYNKHQGFEQIYIKISFLLFSIAVVLYLAGKVVSTGEFFKPLPEAQLKFFADMTVFGAAIALCFARRWFFLKGLLENRFIYFADKFLYIFIIIFIIRFTDIGSWFYLGLLLPIMITTLVKGHRTGHLLLLASLITHIALFAADIPLTAQNTVSADFRLELCRIFAWYAMFYVAVLLFSQLQKCNIESEIESVNNIERLEEKCLKLESSWDEIKNEYDRLNSSAGKLEESNKSLSKSIAEFYTLHQISQAIGSVLDIKELLKRLNDIILGVMGVSYSTIILYDENINRLKVHTTNITNINELATMTDNINSGIMTEALNNGKTILENNVDYMQYVFTCGREINSLICVPLVTSSRKYGLVLVEHKYNNAFDEENVRLLSIIAQQVGIVMENAELYDEMRELARKDGLTGIYNRHYFQERLEIEFHHAKTENYPLSLVIFDIDHFKRFNDNYGHMFGDMVLTSIAKAVKAALRKNDMMARYGGEEFIILLPRTNLSEAYEKVETLRRLVEKHIIEDNLISVSVTASFGISSFDECVLNENELVRTADDALYDAKAAGRNCVMTARKLLE
ncbi:MAG TPA: sensor domain-containing diguanylate cyclase [Clostridia bacterium]|nr:sensor domain-containing diguanylate cyclase [Clostridia bacterium]